MKKRNMRHKAKAKPLNKAVYLIALIIVAVAAALILAFYPEAKTETAAQTQPQETMQGKTVVNVEVLKASIFPEKGYKTKIVLGDAIPKLVETGAIDLEKFKKLYASRGGLTEEQLKLLTQPTTEPLVMTPESMGFLINVLWPLGIANKNPVLDETADYDGVANLAATGGWNLGKEDTMTFFNKHEIGRASC